MIKAGFSTTHKLLLTYKIIYTTPKYRNRGIDIDIFIYTFVIGAYSSFEAQ